MVIYGKCRHRLTAELFEVKKMIQKFKDGTKLISGDDFEKWADRVCNMPDSKKIGCAECKHASDEDYCNDIDCSHLWDGESCRCHINPPCSKCVNNAFEAINIL